MDADVIIVGAGPAGSTCARLLGERGRRVLLLDRSRFPRDKPCGGWVNLKAFKEFPELERLRVGSRGRRRLVEDAFYGLVFHSPDMARSAAYTSRAALGYTVLRRQFDDCLLRLAAASARGVRFLGRRQVVQVEIGEEGVAVVAADGRRFEGKILIGADGADSTVARLCGLTEGWPPERQVLCLAREVALDVRAVNRLHGKRKKIHIALGYGSVAGYAWAFPKRSTINVGVGCRADVAQGLDQAYGGWIEDLRKAGLLPRGCRATKPVAAMEPAGGAIDYEGHVGKRTVLIGDAGGFVSAATGEGVYPAMLSAKVAALSVDTALKSAQAQDVLLEFKFAWRRRFAEYIQMPNANLGFLLPLIYDNEELCNRFARCYLFGENF